MTLKKIAFALAAPTLALGLVACSHKAPERFPAPRATDAGITLTQIDQWQDELARSGVLLVKQGWRLTLILPADRFFRPGTAELYSASFPLLNKIARIVDKYSNSTTDPFPIKVWGHSDDVYRLTQQKIYSTQYAQAIGSFLWKKGLSHRQLSIVGQGMKNPIAPQSTALGRHYNRRVVIQVH